ncbi:MAG: hypothetical protein ACLFR1_13920 [Spirochaetia bacterium]
MVIELDYKYDGLIIKLLAKNIEYDESALEARGGDAGTDSLLDSEGHVYEYEIVKMDVTWEKHFETALWEIKNFPISGLYTVPILGIERVSFRTVIESIRDHYRKLAKKTS